MRIDTSKVVEKIGLNKTSLALRRFFAFSILFTAFGFSCLSYGRQIRSGGNSYLSGDWLINYSGGFVRRGLFGEVYRNIFPEGQLGLWYLFAFQCSLYALILYFFIKYLTKEDFSWPSLVLICSPASFAFIGWDTAAFARKESLGFVSLMIIAIAVKKMGTSFQIIKYFGFLSFILSIFISEINFIMLPSVIYILINSPNKDNKSKLLVKSSFVIVLSSIALIATLVAQGSRLQKEAICDSLIAINLKNELCSGAISYLGVSTQHIQSQLFSSDYFPRYFGYLPLLLLAFIPIATTFWFRKNYLWVFLIFSFSLPLYFVGLDYGRWIHIFIMQVTILIIFKGLELKNNSLWNPASVIFFVILWGIPHFGYSRFGGNSALITIERGLLELLRLIQTLS